MLGNVIENDWEWGLLRLRGEGRRLLREEVGQRTGSARALSQLRIRCCSGNRVEQQAGTGSQRALVGGG